MITLIGGVCVCAILCIVLFKSLTFDPDFDRIRLSPYMTSNKGKVFKLNSCSEPVPMSVSREKPGYKFDYTIPY